MSGKFSRVVVIAGLMSVSAFASQADIVKIAIANCVGSKICYYWWPKLAPLPGWHAEERANFANGDGNGINALVPDGSNFVNADVVMYAQAVFKGRYEAQNPKSKTLDAFITDDRTAVAQDHNDMRIEEAATMTTGDGQKLRSLTYFRSGEWERVAYGEEGGYYLMFVINAHSESSYRASLPAYESLVRSYRK